MVCKTWFYVFQPTLKKWFIQGLSQCLACASIFCDADYPHSRFIQLDDTQKYLPKTCRHTQSVISFFGSLHRANPIQVFRMGISLKSSRNSQQNFCSEREFSVHTHTACKNCKVELSFGKEENFKNMLLRIRCGGKICSHANRILFCLSRST